MHDITQINNTSIYRNPATQSPLQGPNVMQPAVVYSKLMLRTIELEQADYVFDQLAEMRTMPSNNGANEIQFKRFLSLAAHTQPLAEGIPPASDQGRMVAIKAKTQSYGRVMHFTDKVNWAIVDPIIMEYTRQLSLKVPETKDLLAQEALLAEAGSYYAAKKSRGADGDTLVPVAGGAVTHIKFLTPDSSPTIDEFRKIVLTMEATKVRPRIGSNFLALISSAVAFDLITDKRVKEYMQWENTARAYTTDFVVDLFSLAFRKAKTIKTDNEYVNADGETCYIYHNPTANKNLITKVKLTGQATIDGELVDLEAKTSEDKTGYSTAGFDPLLVHHSFVLGSEALFRVGVEGHTEPQFIKKELGSAGTLDPLNQRQSIGWKIDSLGYKVANPDAVIDYMSIPTNFRVNVNARPDLKNQFTDYNYGFIDSASGKYYHPDQIVETYDGSGNLVYRVRGVGTVVVPTKLTNLVKPIGSGRIGTDGKRPVVIGDTPNAQYALKTNKEIRFMEHQVLKHTDSKFYIKGLAGVSTAEVVALPVTYSKDLPLSDGTAITSQGVITDDGHVNKTGDDRID